MKAVLVHLPDVPWHCLTQDSAAPLLPTFLKLIEGGTAGLCAPVGPHPVMDGIIMTGARPDQNGLLTAHEVRQDGFGVDLVSAIQLKAPTLWQYLDAAKLRCASVNMLATNFGQLDRGMIVSDAFCEIRAANFDAWGIPPGAISPLRMGKELADFRVHPEDLDVAQIAPFLVDEPPREGDARPRIIARILAENSTAHAAATFLLENENLDFCAVRYPALAQLKTAFPSPLQSPPGSGAAWGFLRLLDAFLARLVELSGNGTVFFVTGGMESAPFWIVHGPGVAEDLLWPPQTSLYDVAPSLLSLFGLKAREMPGSLPPDIFRSRPTSVVSAASAPALHVRDASATLALENFTANGLQKTGPSRAQHEMLKAHRFKSCLAVAEAARLDCRHADAIEAYTASLDIMPDDRSALAGFCRSLASLSRTDEARAIFKKLRVSGAEGAEVRIIESEINRAEAQRD